VRELEQVELRTIFIKASANMLHGARKGSGRIYLYLIRRGEVLYHSVPHNKFRTYELTREPISRQQQLALGVTHGGVGLNTFKYKYILTEVCDKSAKPVSKK
jgi:hypothetical protein